MKTMAVGPFEAEDVGLAGDMTVASGRLIFLSCGKRVQLVMGLRLVVSLTDEEVRFDIWNRGFLEAMLRNLLVKTDNQWLRSKQKEL